MKQPKKTELAYIAGIVDGEGCISIHITKKRPVGSLSICINNTNLDMLKFIVRVFGGKIYEHKFKHKVLGHRKSYVWRPGKINTQRFLAQILPYLIVKRKNAMIALKFLALLGKGGKKLPLKNKQRRERLFKEYCKVSRR